MAGVVDALRGRRVIAELPAGTPDWMGVCEVLLQEGVGAWSFHPADADTLTGALRVFGRRARIGVREVRTAEQVRDAVALGVHFVTSSVTAPELLAAASGTPLALGALTPTEVHHALVLGAPTVHVTPADALGLAYARSLAELFPEAELLASGRLERFQCDLWRQSGAGAVGLAPSVLFPTAEPDGRVDLDALRRRAQAFGDLA